MTMSDTVSSESFSLNKNCPYFLLGISVLVNLLLITMTSQMFAPILINAMLSPNSDDAFTDSMAVPEVMIGHNYSTGGLERQ